MARPRTMPLDSKRTLVYLTPADLAHIKQLAIAQRTSQAQVVRKAVIEYLARQKAANDPT